MRIPAFTHWLRAATFLTVAVGVAASLSGVGARVLADSNDRVSHDESIGHGPIPAWVSAVVARTESPGPEHSVRLVIAADQVFAQDFGSDWELDAMRMVMSAAPLMELASVTLNVVDTIAWTSSPPDAGLVGMLVEMVATADLPDDAIIIGLTTRTIIEYPNYDGWVTDRVPIAMIKVSPSSQERTDSLIAHELGHLLGAGHHEDGHLCTDGGCIMDAVGYSYGDRWCDHHSEEIGQFLDGV